MVKKNKNIIIKSFNAGAGDSFYLYFPKEKFNILIDGGYGYTYDNEIKPTLQEIKERGEILDLLIVTHMCDDHIRGIIKLIEENGTNVESKVIKIGEVWCNTFYNMYKSDEKLVPPLEVKERLKSIFPWEYNEHYTGDIGIARLNSLSCLLLEGDYIVNSKPIVCDTNLIIEKGDIKFKILSPNKEAIDKLIKKFIKDIPKDIKELEEFYKYELSEYYDRFMSTFIETSSTYTGNVSVRSIETLSRREFSEDTSISNKSSIAFSIEYTGKKLIFLGDAVPSIYFNKLKEHYPNLTEESFELVKLSHHGSKENTTLEFFKSINSKYYLISTNGNNHSHPDQETIARIIIGSKNKVNMLINCENNELEDFISSNNLTENYKLNFTRNNCIEV